MLGRGHKDAPGSWRVAVGALCVALVGLSACSGDDDSASGAKTGGSTSTSASAPTPTTEARPAGPAADMSKALTGGKGVFMGEATTPELERDGYVQREYVAAGTATSYKEASARTPDGRWTFEPDAKAAYRTRVVVRAPKAASKFSGTVMVEWLNVSGGVDANPEWVSTAEELERSGDIWVGVSVQRIGVEGGPVIVKVENIPGAEAAGKGLKAIDPERYGSLSQPGDGYAFDIFTQVARAVRDGAGLDGLQPKQVIAGGESQSAIALVTYYNGVQPLTHAFDGFFVHSRGAFGLPLVAPGKYADLAGSFGGQSTIFRTDQAAPIMDIQTETDVASILNSYAARQPDTDRFRLWEVTGTAHADAHLVGPNASRLNCGVPINNGAMHIVAKAAFHALKQWLATGEAPKIAPRIDVAPGATPTVRRDRDGIALGGIRTPPVDVPVTVLSGAPGPNPSTICLLLGSAQPLPPARIAELYSSRAEYEQKYEQATDATIKAGFAVQGDREALLGFADPSAVSG
jgi:alpha/beta hydrolase family protein